jgi:localization factor PodJL
MPLRVAAAGGDPSAEFEVGSRLSAGGEGKPDYEEAVVWYRRAAIRGFAPAQYRLAVLYERGWGLPVDLARAKVWYTRAAEGGNVKAMHNVAVLTAREGDGAAYAAAAVWFREAAERGLSDSQFNLAILFENGMGVPRDLKQAFKWFGLAASGGDPEAARRLTVLKPLIAAEDIQSIESFVKSWQPKPVDPMNDLRAAGEAWKSRSANAS